MQEAWHLAARGRMFGSQCTGVSHAQILGKGNGTVSMGKGNGTVSVGKGNGTVNVGKGNGTLGNGNGWTKAGYLVEQ